MDNLIRLSFTVSYLFWGGLIAFSVFMLLMYNVHLDLFKYQCESVKTFQVVNSSKNDKLDVNYFFTVRGKKYEESTSFYSDVWERNIGNKRGSIPICYNSSFPNFSFIEGINFNDRYYNTAFVIGVFFFGLTLLFDVFGNKKQMAEKYRKALR